LIQLLQGLKSLHDLGIFHRDIKCANLLLSKDHQHLKLGDLNVAKVVGKADALAQTLAGTPYYTSPELWQDLPYDARCDVWSLGCVVYEMANLQPPFLARELDTLQKKVTIS
jgi:NIMA (never in mitosis gene a)-related kinase